MKQSPIALLCVLILGSGLFGGGGGGGVGGDRPYDWGVGVGARFNY